MSSPAARVQAADPEEAATVAIVVALLAGLSLPDTTTVAVHVLGSLGISPQAASDAVALVVPQILPDSREPVRPAARVSVRNPETGTLEIPAPDPPTPAQAFTRTTEVPRHSRYLVAAAKRFEAAQSQEEGQAIMRRERRYLAQHLDAVRLSREAAQRVDGAVVRHGQTLGWWAHLDSRTTSECRAAHGANFDVARPPLIGYPGTLHGGTCRCHAGPAHKTVLTVDQATAALRQNAVIPFPTELSEPWDDEPRDLLGRWTAWVFRGGKDFPSMKGRKLFGILQRAPLRYRVHRQTGSHRHLRSEAGHPDVLFAYHDKADVRGRAVRDILVKDVGLSEDEAKRLL